MVTHEENSPDLTEDRVDRIFHALADSTRRDIIRRTLTEETTISALASSYNMTFTAVQKHITVLESAELVTKIKNGRERRVRTNPETLNKARSLLAAYEELWRSRINQLDSLLADD